PYVLEAIEALAGLGPEGLAAVREGADRPQLKEFVPVLMRVFGEKKFAASVPWLRARCRAAIEDLNEKDLPFDPEGADVMREDAQAYQEVRNCLRALAQILDPAGSEEARDGAAWFLSHKADWWYATFHSSAEAEPFLKMIRLS